MAGPNTLAAIAVVSSAGCRTWMGASSGGRRRPASSPCTSATPLSAAACKELHEKALELHSAGVIAGGWLHASQGHASLAGTRCTGLHNWETKLR